MEEAALTSALRRLDPQSRDELRRLLIRDQANRDAVAQQALRRGRSDLADIIDMLTLDDDIRRRVVRQLGELVASD